jgi:hypothetical protein
VSGATDGIVERFKGLASGFAAYSALGSFLLYLLGYLALRFHLTFIGVATDLAVLDERYLFAGASCLVFLASSLPIAVMVAALLAALAYLPYRLLPQARRRALRERIQRFVSAPVAPTVLGIALALAFIQVLMRKSFRYANVLVQDRLPESAGWLNTLLSNDKWKPIYFSVLILGIAMTGGLLLRSPATGDDAAKAPSSRPLRMLLGTLVAIQVLLLPVNFGVLVHGKSLPRVKAVPKHALAAGEQAWLAWDGKSTVSFVVKAATGERSLVTVDREATKDTELVIIGYDRLADVLASTPAERKDVNADADN